MDDRGISNERGASSEIALAHNMCDLLGGGYTIDGLTKHYVVTGQTSMSEGSLRYFVETAAATYCPQHVR